MLLPDKHIRISESIIGLSAFVLEHLRSQTPFDALIGKLGSKFETVEWPAYHNTETVVLALCFLYSIGAIEVTADGELRRCD